ncbi:MAG TPA: PstS family phosphate ABC transporter substrate-binding protein [Ardenticatenaceae bacterium]
MRSSSRKRYGILSLLLVLVLVLAACGGAASTTTNEAETGQETAPTEEAAPVAEEPTEEAAVEPTEATMEEEGTTEEAEGAGGEMMTLPEVDTLAVTGDIVVAGSSTVYPLTLAMAERFTDEGYADQITIDEIGSGAGFERFCINAETDIANASRAIDEEESAACEENGRPAIEFRVGTDALAIVVSADNDFVDELTLEQLAQIFSGEAATWDQVDPSFPAEAIELYSPGSDSGTYDFFVEEVLEDDPSGLDASGAQFSEDDNVLVQGVQASPYAISYFGYAYYLENEDALKILTIDGVEPTAETAESGDYPLARPLFVYSAQSVMEEKPQVADFINYYLTFVNEEIEDVGYFPASEETLNEARQHWLDAMGQ